MLRHCQIPWWRIDRLNDQGQFHEPPLEKLRIQQSSNITIYHNMKRIWHHMHGTLGAKLPIKRNHSRSLLEALDLPGLHFLQLLQLFQTICDCDTCLASPEKIVQAATAGSFRISAMEEGWQSKLVVSWWWHPTCWYWRLIHLRRPCHPPSGYDFGYDFCVWDMSFWRIPTLSNLGTCNKSVYKTSQFLEGWPASPAALLPDSQPIEWTTSNTYNTSFNCNSYKRSR